MKRSCAKRNLRLRKRLSKKRYSTKQIGGNLEHISIETGNCGTSIKRMFGFSLRSGCVTIKDMLNNQRKVVLYVNDNGDIEVRQFNSINTDKYNHKEEFKKDLDPQTNPETDPDLFYTIIKFFNITDKDQSILFIEKILTYIRSNLNKIHKIYKYSEMITILEKYYTKYRELESYRQDAEEERMKQLKEKEDTRISVLKNEVKQKLNECYKQLDTKSFVKYDEKNSVCIDTRRSNNPALYNDLSQYKNTQIGYTRDCVDKVNYKYQYKFQSDINEMNDKIIQYSNEGNIMINDSLRNMTLCTTQL
jgi:hypothetical protein